MLEFCILDAMLVCEWFFVDVPWKAARYPVRPDDTHVPLFVLWDAIQTL